jgi:hypothetical protein
MHIEAAGIGIFLRTGAQHGIETASDATRQLIGQAIADSQLAALAFNRVFDLDRHSARFRRWSASNGRAKSGEECLAERALRARVEFRGRDEPMAASLVCVGGRGFARLPRTRKSRRCTSLELRVAMSGLLGARWGSLWLGVRHGCNRGGRHLSAISNYLT